MLNWMLQTVAVWATLGYVLSAAGLTIADWLFWCVLAMAWLIEYLAKEQGRREGYVIGTADIMLLELRIAELQQLTDKLNKDANGC